LANYSCLFNTLKMKTFAIIFFLFIICSTCKSQESYELNFNDTSYCRILNGTILKNNYIVKGLGAVQYITDKQKIKEFGINTGMPLMIVNIKSLKIEYQVDSILYSRPDFISAFKFPSTIQLPICINGQLLAYDDRQELLTELDLNKIKEIRYVDNASAMKRYGVTPFGVIDLILK
jgi:hypothetical protein